MRALLLSILAALLLVVPNAAAHTYLDTTTPQDGESVTAELQTIVLTYSGQIEEGSTFNVQASDGTRIAIDSITLQDGVLTGQLSAPLVNDTYKVMWNSISQDGHPLSGEFSFTVDVPVNEEATEVEQVIATEENETTETETATTQEVANQNEDKSSTTPLLIVGAILVVLILVSLVTLAKRKKTK